MYKTSFPRLENIGPEPSGERLVFGHEKWRICHGDALVEVSVSSYSWVALEDSSERASGSSSFSNCSAVKEKRSGNDKGLERWTYLVPTHLPHHFQE